MARGLETVIERADNGKAVAWFPAALTTIVTHSSGRTWAGALANYLCLITLEGAEELSPAKEHPESSVAAQVPQKGPWWKFWR